MTRRITKTEFLQALRGHHLFANFGYRAGIDAEHFAKEFWKSKQSGLGSYNDEERRQQLLEIVDSAVEKMLLEQAKLIQARNHITGIFGRASIGGLMREMALPNNIMNPGRYNAGQNETDINKAAKWVANASGSFTHMNCPVTEHDVAEAIQYLSKRNQFFTPEMVKYIRKKTFFGPKPSFAALAQAKLKKFKPSLPKLRSASPRRNLTINIDDIADLRPTYMTFPDSAVRWAEEDHPYPGTVAGQYFLFNTVFPLADQLRTQVAAQAGNRLPATPLDLACFVLGAFVATHPYKDGNGRTARVLYAATLIKYGEPFVAPSMNMENRLNGL